MSLYGAFDTTKHLEELATPLSTSQGVLSAATRRARVLLNLSGTAMTAAQLAALAGVTPGAALANKAVVLGAAKEIATLGAVTMAALIATTGAFSGVITPTGGIAAANSSSVSPRGIWAGQEAPTISTDYTDATPVITETYVSEIFVPCNTTITGIVIFNGSNVTGNVFVGLATAAGAPIAAAVSVATAGSGVDAMQRVPFTTPYVALGPQTFYVQVQYSSGVARYNAHPLGNHGVVAQVAQTFGVLTSFTPPTTFVTNIGGVVGLY